MRRIKVSKIDRILGRVLKYRRGFKCERCGTKYDKSSTALGISHFIGRSCRAVRWDPDNLDVVCTGCHSYLETYKPTKYRDRVIKRLGMRAYNKLVKKSEGRGPNKKEKEKLYEKLKKELKKYG